MTASTFKKKMFGFPKAAGLLVTLHACSPSLREEKISLLPQWDPIHHRSSLTQPLPRPPTKLPPFRTPVSLDVSYEIPLQEVFAQLCRNAQMNLVVQTSLKGKKIYFRAHQQPFIEIIQHVCKIADLRFFIEGNTLHIQENKPYFFTYAVPFLLGHRQTQSHISVMTDVFSGVQDKGITGENGSDTKLTSGATADFWVELEQNLSLLLGSKDQKTAPTFTVHKQAGLISVYATQTQHQWIQDYLKKLKNLTSAQVMIEAKIIEVTLRDEFKTGINWNVLKGNFAGFFHSGSLAKPGFFDPQAAPERDVFTLAFFNGDLSIVANFIEKFGSVRTLCSPRLTVLNNQPAVLKAAKNEVFFRLDVERLIVADGKPDVETTSSRVQTVPIGLVMVVHPCVNLETKEITLTLRPTISRVVERKSDPAVAIKSDYQIDSWVPVVQVREMDSVLTMRSGDVIVMGGLMEETTASDESHVPGLKEIPIISSLFEGKEKNHQLTELVIFLRASIVENTSTQPSFSTSDNMTD